MTLVAGMPRPVVYFWKKAPFIRLLPPLIAGIILQWYLQLSPDLAWSLLMLSSALVIIYFTIPFFQRFRLAWLDGIAITFLFISIGSLLVWHNDVRHNKSWFGSLYADGASLVVTLDEPLAEKAKSFKAAANVDYVIQDNQFIKAEGKILVYFKKDSLLPELNYGSRVLLRKSLQEIKNAGNPGGFDFKRYCLFQGITHQVYLKPDEFELVGQTKHDINTFLYSIRDAVLTVLRTGIKGEKESGLAEALLIGYKDDLDKTLVQSYSNTGVVHIIAISGMHLALIYWLIELLLKPLGKKKKWKWVKSPIAIVLLWAFSLLTGASASVLRAAVMFTFILLAESFSRRTSIYNSLAASAFCLLCYDPFWLWDVGFQLSYAAVLSIVVFQKSIYNLFYCKNKLLDWIWKLNAVTFAAQLLTTPLSIFHFHQFPVYFFLTNIVAVPLSSVIVLGEILLCVICFIPVVTSLVGKLLSWLIMLMNGYVEKIEAIPGSLWDGLQINIIQTLLLFIIVVALACWLMESMKRGLIIGLTALLIFFVLRTWSFMQAQTRSEIIIYNIPQSRAIDFIEGRNYFFYGDSGLLTDAVTRSFHLQPSRTRNRSSFEGSIDDLLIDDKWICFKGKRILVVDTAISFLKQSGKYDLDLLIISHNPKIYIAGLANNFNIRQVVFDASVASWKLRYWIKDCDSLHIPYHDVNEKGAFVMRLN